MPNSARVREIEESVEGGKNFEMNCAPTLCK